MKIFNVKYFFDWRPRKWHTECSYGIRIHDYFSLMINQFPILVIRKFEDPNSDLDWITYSVGFFGITFSKYLHVQK